MSNVIPNPNQVGHQPWLRYWLPEKYWNANPGIDDDFLPDFGQAEGEEPSLESSLPGIGTLQAFRDVPFLFLLGRPGSGKSRELEQAKKHGWLGTNCCWIEGKEFSSDIAATLDRVMKDAPKQTRLFIDGLDEALLEHVNFVPKLKRWLLDHHLGSDGEPTLKLAITCRWANWPEQSVNELAALWQADRSKYLMLCPLRRSDAVQTIKQRFGETAELFLNQLNDHHLKPVACWPQGLLGLFEQFEQSAQKSICSSYSQAIEGQVLRHCRLADSPDDSARWTAALTIDGNWRRRVAARLAAAMIWSGKNRLNLRRTDTADDSLTEADFRTQDELWDNSRKSVQSKDLDDLVHKSRLMRRLSGDAVWVFESQVHQEFLAAEWLAVQNLDEARFMQLFGREIEGRWRVQPALGAVAAWLAGRDTLFRQIVIKHDPLVLLRIDGARVAESERREIVEALLEATELIRVLDPAILQAHLPSLTHARLHAQLERWLRRSDVCVASKELAIEIAEKTKLESLAPVLWELYPESTGRVQIEMAGALYRLARASEYDAAWQSVLQGELPIDGYGTLLGAAIELQIHSGKKPVAAALKWLVPARRFEVYGRYDAAVRSLPDRLRLDDLPEVFMSLGVCPELVRDSLNSPHHLHKAAVKLGIAHFDRPEVAEVLCDYWHQCLAHHVHPHHDINSSWKADELGIQSDAHRRSIIRALVLHPGFLKHTEPKWFWSSEYLVNEEDFDWSLQELFQASSENRWRWALVVASALWRTDLSGERGMRLQQAWVTMPEVRSFFPAPAQQETLPEAIIRLSEEHRLQRELEAAKWRTEHDEYDQKFQADLARYTQDCKKAHEQGELTWGGVIEILSARTHGPGSSTVTFEPISRIGPDDAWMIDSAIRNLLELPDKRPIELSDGLNGLLALAACLLRVSQDAELRMVIGRHWLAPMLADFSMAYLEEVPDGISWERFAEWFPAELPSAIESVVRHRYLNNSELGELGSFRSCWSVECGTKLASLLKDEPIQVAGFFNALRMLADQNESLAVEVLRFWLSEDVEKLNHDQKATLAGAALLLLNGRCVEDVFQGELLDNQEVAKDSIWRSVQLLDSHGRSIDFSKWADDSIRQVAELCGQIYTRVERTRSNRMTFSAITGEDEAIDFRDRIISEATQRGIYLNLPVAVEQDTPEQAARRRLALDWHRNEATKARQKVARVLLNPGDLFCLCSTPNARLARDADELMAAVVASVQRWEQTLISGKWTRLWDLKPLRARDEEDIAKELRDWLHDDLNIISEREVELHSEHRTDVLVQTLTQWGQKITVLIELKKVRKGNAKERRTAMQTQLRDTYLKERQSEGWTHGLFVVAWTPEPGHKLDSDSAMQAEADFLMEQAKNLSEPPFVLKSLVVDARARQNEKRR